MRVNLNYVLSLILIGCATMTQAQTAPRVASGQSAPCGPVSQYFWPRGSLWPVALQWTESGRVRLMTCSHPSPASQPRTPEIIGELMLPGVEARVEALDLHLYLMTGDGPLDLGSWKDAPCMGSTLSAHSGSLIKGIPQLRQAANPPEAARPTVDQCALSVGEVPTRGDRGVEWVVSLVIGTEGGVATEARLPIPAAVVKRLSEI